MSSPATAAVLRTSGLTKRYGKHAALDQLSLELFAGSFVALLGPNGAGKSTLFQVLTGLFAADEGDVQVDGHGLRRSVGALGGRLVAGGGVFCPGAVAVRYLHGCSVFFLPAAGFTNAAEFFGVLRNA